MTYTIPKRETLTVEFKSDRKRLADRELVAAVVCLANTEGGEIYLGVEDDGSITGLHSAHGDPAGLAAMVANHTIPPVAVKAALLREDAKTVMKVSVSKSRQLIATSDGMLQRRKVGADGRPECVPFYPHEFFQRHAELGLLDYSALPVSAATMRDFDPLERERLRQCVDRYGGDKALAGLSDQELDAALGLARRAHGKPMPTVAGLLLLGREAAIREHLPTHEVAFQVLEGTDVRVNDFYRMPLLKTFERIQDQFAARVVEQELQVGLFRVPVPNYDQRAFREALVNALIHRDYTRLGAVHVRWESDDVIVSNPGGFVEGVTLDNLLVVEPRPRNPALADAIKRIGLAERTGRGIDLIYQGLLRYGRPAPDYSRSSPNSVVVVLPGGSSDLDLLRMILDEERRIGGRLPVEAMIALANLRRERRLDTRTLAAAIQRDEASARSVLERLVEAGLVEAHGSTKSRTYTLSAHLYRKAGQAGDYVRQTAFDSIQQEQMVMQFVEKHGQITRKEVVSLCRLNEDQAAYILRKLRRGRSLELVGSGRGAYYRTPKNRNAPDRKRGKHGINTENAE
jgi:ATP-dependent DNA helicase RecG